jgi:hypothetical protein
MFFFYKIREQEGRTGYGIGGLALVGDGTWWGKVWENEYSTNNI